MMDLAKDLLEVAAVIGAGIVLLFVAFLAAAIGNGLWRGWKEICRQSRED